MYFIRWRTVPKGGSGQAGKQLLLDQIPDPAASAIKKKVSFRHPLSHAHPLTTLSDEKGRNKDTNHSNRTHPLQERMHFLGTSLLLLFVPLVSAQAPFPVVATALGNPSQIATISSLAADYDASVRGAPAWTSFFSECSTLVVPAPIATFFAEENCDAVLLAVNFVTATATPDWYSALPSDGQSYVSSIAQAEATIIEKTLGINGAERVFGDVRIMAALLTATFVVVLAL